MELIIGKTAGFCFGVRNAVNKTYEQIENNIPNLYCLGELVHNERIIDNFKKSGIVTINDIKDVKNSTSVIIRAHGVEPRIYDELKKKNINIIDLTCPKVVKIHKLAEEFVKDKNYIMLIAENKHPETVGTKEFCGENCTIIENLEDVDFAIKNFEQSKLKKIAIIAQTTFSVEKFQNIVNIIKQKVDCEIKIENTICNATAMRQAETEELSKNVDLMIVIGGKNSANTKRLYDISAKNCKNAILIQSKDDEILKVAMNKKYKKIGIMAGASTPQESINEVAQYIKNIYQLV